MGLYWAIFVWRRERLARAVSNFREACAEVIYWVGGSLQSTGYLVLVREPFYTYTHMCMCVVCVCIHCRVCVYIIIIIIIIIIIK